MQSHKVVLSLIDVVVALAEVEVEYTDRVDLLHALIGVPKVDVFGDGLRHAVEDALKVEYLRGVLHLYDYNLALAVAGLYVYAVELVVGVSLVSLAFKDVHHFHLLTEEYGEEAFQHSEVCFLSQQAFHSPVKAYVFVVHTHYIYVCA